MNVQPIMEDASIPALTQMVVITARAIMAT